MANKILKSLALVAGTGVALGVGASLGRRRNTEPIPLHPGEASALEALESRLERQTKEIAELRAQMNESGRQGSTRLAALERRFTAAGAELPAAIETAVSPRVNQLRSRLSAEMREATENGLARIDHAIDERLTGRIEALEKTLTDQSGAIAALNWHAIETDARLQRLISSVERFCDRADARPAPAPVAEPSFLDLPFQAQYEAALQSEPANPPRMFVPAFRPSAVREEDEKAELAGNPRLG